jgi:macrophage erythroblast attacher
MQEFSDLSVFKEIRQIAEQIRESHSCKEALIWCASKRSRLVELKSQLEFNLRMQEFAMFVFSDQPAQAVEYAQKFLVKFAQSDPDQMEII